MKQSEIIQVQNQIEQLTNIINKDNYIFDCRDLPHLNNLKKLLK